MPKKEKGDFHLNDCYDTDEETFVCELRGLKQAESKYYSNDDTIINEYAKMFFVTDRQTNHNTIPGKAIIARFIAFRYLQLKNIQKFAIWIVRATEHYIESENDLIFSVRILKNNGYIEEATKLLKIGADNDITYAIIDLSIDHFNVEEYEDIIQLSDKLVQCIGASKDHRTYYDCLIHYILAKTYLKTGNIEKFSFHAKHSYTLRSRYSDFALNTIIDYCDENSDYELLTELIIDDMESGTINFTFFNDIFTELNKDRITEVMCKQVENNASGSDYYLDKYFFHLAYYIHCNGITPTNPSILEFLEKVEKSSIGECDICISSDVKMISFKDLKRMKECTHSACFRCLAMANLSCCPYCRSSLAKISYCNVVKNSSKTN